MIKFGILSVRSYAVEFHNADLLRKCGQLLLRFKTIILISVNILKIIVLHFLNCVIPISEIDEEIKIKISRRKGDLAIALSVPGMAFISATAILAEIGNYNDFDKPEQLAAWCGLVPSLYQSADKCLLGGITKQGSRHIRRMLVEVAFAISRTKNCRLNQFFLKIQAKKGPKVAAVALARKILCILHHLLVNKEKYEEIGFKKWRTPKFEPTRPPREISLIEMIDLVIEAGYQVKKRGAV